MSDKKDLHWQKRQGRIKDENISNKENEVEIMEKTMDKIIALAKARGFVYPGSEIYGGLANTWDYGPLGVELVRDGGSILETLRLDQHDLQLGGSVDVDHLVAVLLSSFLRGVGFFWGWRTALTTAREDIILFVIIHIGICFGILVDSEDVSQTIYHGHGSYSLRLLSCINCTKKAPIGFCHNYTVFIIFHFCFVVNTNICLLYTSDAADE